MSEKNKKRLAALEILAKKARARGKSILSKQDKLKDTEEKLIRDRNITDIANSGKSNEDLEREAKTRLYRDRMKRGLNPRKSKK